MKIRLILAALLLSAGFAVWVYRQLLRPVALPPKPRTVEQVLDTLGPPVERRLRRAFRQAGISYPPRQLAFLAFKAEKRLEVYAQDDAGKFHPVKSYPILAASGSAGPKLREGDRQVPEGLYRIELLNPNSRFHLSLRVGYPNAADIARARADGRDVSALGSDIMIHGGAASIGCLAVGDPAIEELFVLAARTGLNHIELILAPHDFREETGSDSVSADVLRLHDGVRERLAAFRAR